MKLKACEISPRLQTIGSLGVRRGEALGSRAEERLKLISRRTIVSVKSIITSCILQRNNRSAVSAYKRLA